jgi:hypothetical protein
VSGSPKKQLGAQTKNKTAGEPTAGSWRGNEKAPKLETAQDRRSRFYTRYSHKDFLHNDLSRLRKGLFQDLQQFVGIGFKRDNEENIVNLFDCDNGEVQELEKVDSYLNPEKHLSIKNIVILFISASCFMRCQLIRKIIFQATLDASGNSSTLENKAVYYLLN